MLLICIKECVRFAVLDLQLPASIIFQLSPQVNLISSSPLGFGHRYSIMIDIQPIDRLIDH